MRINVITKSGFLNNNKIRILLCVQLLLLLIGVTGLIFGKSGVISGTDDTESLINNGISLGAGSYKITLYYETDDAAPGDFGINTENYGYKMVLANNVPIYAGINERECHFILTGRVDDVQIELNLSDNVEVKGIELSADKGCYRVFIFMVVLCSGILDAFLAMWMYNKKIGISHEKQLVIFGIPMAALVASIPVLVDYNIMGADLVYHIMRIEALTQSVLKGELSVRMQSAWLAGHGYASNFFYGDTLLAFPALLRIIGFTPDSAYRMYVAAVNLGTAIIAYISFSKCFKSRYIGIFGCVLYTLAPYRVYNIYNRGAVGEYTAMMFLPLLVWGFYRIYTEDTDAKGYMWNWLIPVIGFSGVIQSHTLSCELAGFFVVLLCILMWKKTFRRKTFGVLCLVVIMTLVINAWFIVPFLDLMMSDSYYFGNNANVLIQERGVYPAQFFYTIQSAGSSSRYHETGMLDAEPIDMGAAMLLCMGLWVVVRVWNLQRNINGVDDDNEQNGFKTYKKAGDLLFVLCCIAMFMSTRLFPWNVISGLGSAAAALTGSIQFPTRITTVVTVIAAALACVTGKYILETGFFYKDSNGNRKILMSGRTALVLIALVSVVFGMYQVDDTLLTKDGILKLYTAENIGYSAVLGAEYLPLGADIGHMTYHAPVVSDSVKLSSYEKDKLTVSGYVENTSSDAAGYIELPMLYYKGYSAYDTDTGEKLNTSAGDNYDVRVVIPAGFAGNIIVRYSGMWYWHAAEALSVFADVALLVYGLVIRRRKKI
jgi:hypothetical protein